MDANSPKLAESGFDRFSAIKVLREWLDREGGNRRIPQALDLLADHTAHAWSRDQPSPAVDPDTLRQLHADAYGGRLPHTPASRWLLSSQVQTWWDARRGSLEHAFRTAQVGVVPMLTIIPGGGRGNPTLYRLDFKPEPEFDASGEERPSVTNNPAHGGVIRYQVESAKASWWLTPIIGTAPFRMRSWRGYLLIGMLVAEALAILALWGVLLLILRGTRPIHVGDFGLLLTLLAVTWTWWHFTKPLIRLPTDRITIANDLFLAWAQLNGQFRLTRDAQSKPRGRLVPVHSALGSVPHLLRGSGDCRRRSGLPRTTRRSLQR